MSWLSPIWILLAGALLVIVGAQVRFRYTLVVPVISTALALAAVLAVGRGELPSAMTTMVWHPVSLFGMPLALYLDGYAWALGVCVLIAVLAASLRWLVQPADRPGATSLAYPALALAMGALMLVAIAAANVLTLALVWGFLDVVYGTALLVREGQASNHRVELVIGFNGVATGLVWLILIFLEQDSLSPYWRLTTLSPLTQVLLGLAAVVRLGLYPWYAWSSPTTHDTASLPVLLYLLPMMAGLALWVRLAAIQYTPGDELWVGIVLAATLLMGLLAWVQSGARQSFSYVAIGYAGLLIVASSGAGMTPPSLTQGVAAWLLGLYALATSSSFRTHTAAQVEEPGGAAAGVEHAAPVYRWARWLWGLPALIAMLTIVGLPATVGWGYRTTLYAGLAETRWRWWILAVLADTLLAGAALRFALVSLREALSPAWEPKLPAPPPQEATRRARLLAWLRQGATVGRLAVSSLGLVVTTLPLIVFGLWPAALFPAWAGSLASLRASPTLTMRGWLGWVVPVVGMVVLVVSRARLPAASTLYSHLSGWGKVAGQVLGLSWLYTLALNSLRRAARLIGGLGMLMEGKGALMWTLLIVALVLLYVRQPWR